MLAFLRRPAPWVIAALLIAALGGWSLFSRHAASHRAKEAADAASVTQTPYAGIASGKADVEGGIIQVAARTAGVIRSVSVQEGDPVAKGEVLAQLEDEQPRLNVANAAAAVRQAQAQIGLLQVQTQTAGESIPAGRPYERRILLRARPWTTPRTRSRPPTRRLKCSEPS